MTTETKSLGLPAFTIDGVDYRVNKYGVVLGQKVPDFMTGWDKELPVPADVAARIEALIQPAFLRYGRNDPIYSIRTIRQIANFMNAE